MKFKRKIEQQYFRIRGAYYTRKYGYFDILRAKLGLRIIRGCVLYAENYGIDRNDQQNDFVFIVHVHVCNSKF